jgi:hypothetical protein
MEALCDFTATICRAARERGADGVVCGHIHHAEMKTVDGVLYANDGDWVDSCTALVEHFDGRLEIVRWTRDPQDAGKEAPPPASTEPVAPGAAAGGIWPPRIAPPRRRPVAPDRRRRLPAGV